MFFKMHPGASAADFHQYLKEFREAQDNLKNPNNGQNDASASSGTNKSSAM